MSRHSVAESLRTGFDRIRSSQLVGPSAVTATLLLLGQVIAFAAQILISRHLGVTGFGEYSILLGWALLMTLPASLGVDGSIMRFMPGYLSAQHSVLYRRLVLLSVVVQYLAVLAIAAILYVLATTGVAALAWAKTPTLAMFAILVTGIVLSNTGAAVLQSAHRVFIAQLFNQIARPLVTLCAVAWLIRAQPATADAHSFFAVTAVSAMAVTVLLGAYIWRSFFTGRATGPVAWRMRDWLNFAIGNLAAGVGLQAMIQLPLLLVGNLSGLSEAGHYAAASRLASIVSIGLVSLATVSMPYLARAHATNDLRELQRVAASVARIGFYFAASATVGVLLLGKALLGLFGSEFIDAYPVLLALVAALLVASAFGPSFAVVAMSGRPWTVAGWNIAGLVTAAAITWWLIPRYGALGGALVYGTGYLVAVGGTAWYAASRLGIDTGLLATRESHHARP